MILELPGPASDHEIGRVKHYKMGFFHFSNNNLAIRKACAEDLGKYDPSASRSEDVDICFRMARDPYWVAFREKDCIVHHKARKTFPAFIRQFWGWGYHVGHPYAKTGIKGIYLYWIGSQDHKIKFHVETEKFPWLVCLFLTHFHIFHLLFCSAILAAMMGHFVLSSVLGLLSLPCLWHNLHDDRKAGLGPRGTCKLAITHYIANVVFMGATILGGARKGLLLIPSSIFRPPPPVHSGPRSTDHSFRGA